MWVKWICPTPRDAKKLAEALHELLRGAHKLRWSTMALAGMVVEYEVLLDSHRVWLVFWAEPEADLGRG